MSDVERITWENHRRAQAEERRMCWREALAREARRAEQREKLRKTAQSVCWLAGTLTSAAGLAMLYIGMTGAAFALCGAGAIAAVMGSVIYEI